MKVDNFWPSTQFGCPHFLINWSLEESKRRVIFSEIGPSLLHEVVIVLSFVSQKPNSGFRVESLNEQVISV